jgi:hypothetical protein
MALDIFRPASQALYLSPGEPLGKPWRKRKAQAVPPQDDLLDAAAFQDRLQPPHDGLDFRKFRHGVVLDPLLETVASPPAGTFQAPHLRA